MGLVGKLKNILFEEEEVEIPVLEKKAPPMPEVTSYKEMPKKEEIKPTNNNVNVNNNYYEEDLKNLTRQEKKLEEQNIANNINNVSERELFKSEKTFNFPAFDEEEFQNVVPRTRRTNVMEHERKKQEKKIVSKVPERKIEEEPPKKFKPSPIISPVYGILDKNYTPDEITTKEPIKNERNLDIDNVRKKAFGVVNEPNLDDKILEEKLEKARTIDELLKDSSDEVITIKEDIEEKNHDYKESVSLENIELSKEKPLDTNQKEVEESIENDLFDLIDSMYENREAV